MKKDNKENKKTCQNKHNDNHNETEKQTKKVDEVNPLEIELKNLQAKYNNLEKINHELETSISHMQKDFIDKIVQKQNEMKVILEEKQNELKELNEQKLFEFKIKFLTKDIVDMLSTIDQFEKIISVNTSNPDVNNYIAGFKMFAKMFENSLLNMGIHKIDIEINDPFDENFMEVIEAVETDNEPNKVIEIISNAYEYEDRIIKFAKVKVSK